MKGLLYTAPMIQWTDRHWRYLVRLVTKRTVLYSEMTMDAALVHNSQHLENFIGHSECEHPLVLQLGGNDPEQLGEAAYLCESYADYHEINLNCGCPSNKAKRAAFGAELMLTPDLVRRIVHEMKRRVSRTEISVKCRLGIARKKETWDDLVQFVSNVREGGVRHVVVHARHCILSGLSPAQNRTIPPLNYDWVHRLAGEFPEMTITLNGGLTTLEEGILHMGNNFRCQNGGSWTEGFYSDGGGGRFSSNRETADVHNVMIGRAVYNDPFILSRADNLIFNSSYSGLATRRSVLEDYLDYCEIVQERRLFGWSTCNLLKPLHNFFHGAPNGENGTYKRVLNDLLAQQTGSNKCNSPLSLQELVWKSVEETISTDFLDALLPN